jgi:hypothetical protein
MTITFALLALSICAVWFPPIRLNQQVYLPSWIIIFLFSICVGFITGCLQVSALISLTALLLFAHLGARARATSFQRIAFSSLAALIALLMAMHRVPGFNNPVLWESLQLSTDAAPFTLYANFDKGAAGLVLLAYFCRRSISQGEFVAVISKALPFIVATPVCVLMASTAVHYVRPDFKLSFYTGAFLAVNLFFTVIPEEAFFRGLIQEKLGSSIATSRAGKPIAVIVSALLFGAVHFAGGMMYVALAALAGLGYALAYARTRSIESAIAVHLLLNAIHFIAFTYPFIR